MESDDPVGYQWITDIEYWYPDYMYRFWYWVVYLGDQLLAVLAEVFNDIKDKYNEQIPSTANINYFYRSYLVDVLKEIANGVYASHKMIIIWQILILDLSCNRADFVFGLISSKLRGPVGYR